MQIFIFLVALCGLVNAGTITRSTTDSYQNIREEEDNIKDNLVDDEFAADIEGLLPPKTDAQDYYIEGLLPPKLDAQDSERPVPPKSDAQDTEGPMPPKLDAKDSEGLLPPNLDAQDYYSQPIYRESTYTMNGDKIQLKADTPADEELTPSERLAMHEIAVAFERLIQQAKAAASDDNTEDDPLKPIVITANDGKAVYMAGPEEVPEVTTVPNGEPETFTTDDSLPADEPRQDQDQGLLGFFSSVWDMVQQSVGFAARLLTNSQDTKSSTESPMLEPSSTTASPSSTSGPGVSSIGDVVAVEEPLQHHTLPAVEGRRDVDTLLYGRGIA